MTFRKISLSGSTLKIVALLAVLVFALGMVAGCSSEKQTPKETIVFADIGWDSIVFNNRIAQFIIENGYGYKTDSIPGESIPMIQGLIKGDVDVDMEMWVQNHQEAYDSGIQSGNLIDLGTNFNDNTQGLYVPTYVIKGDPARGIKPMAPDLKSIDDLPKYWELFRDPEDPQKGRILGAVPGWDADKILSKKMETYDLNKTYNLFRPGSSAALDSSLVAAYEKGEPWLGYNWEPTWIVGKYDLTLIEEPPYNKEQWDKDYGCAFPSVDVNIVIHKDLPQKAPEVVEFLKKFSLNSSIISEALAYMQDNNASAEDAAMWFLKEKSDIWTKWVSEDTANKVKAKL